MQTAKQPKPLPVTIMEPLAPLRNERETATSTPASYVRSLFPKKRVGGDAIRRMVLGTPDEEQLEAYDHDVAGAIRSNDVDLLRELLDEGRDFTGCNRNGETMLHLACRRSDLDTVEFLIVEAGLSTERRDTVGRSCLHDACWRAVPDLELMDFLVRSVSPLLLVEEDCRGHSCMDYVRPSDYETWNAFITKYSGLIQRRSKLVGMFAS